MKPFQEFHEAELKQTGCIALACKQRNAAKRRRVMNHSIQSADRATHVKIVIVALVAGAVLTAFGTSLRPSTDFVQTVHVMKAGQPTMVSNSGASLVR